MKTKKINNVGQLRDALHGSDDCKDFAIVLGGGGMFSRKEIALMKTPTGKERFFIFNSIDGSTQFLSDKKLIDERYTNIGEAMSKGAFYQLI